jgi:hypothetical protein
LNEFHVLHNVVVGEDVASVVDDDPCPHPVDLAEWIAGARFELIRANGFPALYVDNGWPALLNCLYDGAAS